MILVDANVLLYAYNTAAEEHAKARDWVERIFSEDEPVALTWHVILAFLRIATNPRAFPRPLSRADAVMVVGEWLERPQTVIVHPGENHWEILQRVLSEGQASAALVSDAHLAAIAVESGSTVYTSDRDFARFPNLKFINPLD